MKVRDDATQWRIHLDRSAWPQRAGLHFIVAAFDEVLSTLWELRTEDLAGDFEDGAGYRNAAAGHFHTALMTGSLIAQAQPSGGGATRPIPSTDWVPDVVDRAIATGRITRKLNGRRDDMWVFIDEAELQLMRGVLALTDMLHRPEDSGPLEAMGATVLGNMSAIAEATGPELCELGADRLTSPVPSAMEMRPSAQRSRPATKLRSRMFREVAYARANGAWSGLTGVGKAHQRQAVEPFVRMSLDCFHSLAGIRSVD